MTREQWYRVKGLKHVTAFVKPADKNFLKKLAKASDQSLVKYLTRLLEKHIQEQKKNPSSFL